jgi:hypothetical protein
MTLRPVYRVADCPAETRRFKESIRKCVKSIRFRHGRGRDPEDSSIARRDVYRRIDVAAWRDRTQ